MSTARKLQRPRILVVDDSEVNRELLCEILEDQYDILQADNGKSALDIIESQHDDLSCVLLDISMGEMNGFQVLERLNIIKLIGVLPVIIISSENTTDFIRRGYSLGAVDYIFRPFDELVVRRRVQNTVTLYANQKKLAKMVRRQIDENERLSDMMISILGHTVEFRNKESNMHIANVSSLTKILLEQLDADSSKYHFPKKEITLSAVLPHCMTLEKYLFPMKCSTSPGASLPKSLTS